MEDEVSQSMFSQVQPRRKKAGAGSVHVSAESLAHSNPLARMPHDPETFYDGPEEGVLRHQQAVQPGPRSRSS